MEEYVGLDVSKEETSFCAMDGAGKILAQGKVASDPESLFEALKEHTLCPARIVLETGTLSGWLARELRKLGLPADVIDARQAHAVMKLSTTRRMPTTRFCWPGSRGRDFAARFRWPAKRRRSSAYSSRRGNTWSVNVSRHRTRSGGFLGSLGIRFPKGSGKLAARVTAALEDRPDLEPMIAPLLLSAEALAVQIAALDREVGARAKAMAACRLLMTVPGVGPVTALAYAATIGDAGRFAKSRDVGAYVGLTSRRNQSGEMDYSGRISKFGDSLLRSQLYEPPTAC